MDFRLLTITALAWLVVSPASAHAQGRGAAPGQAPQTAKTAAAIDMTGTWVSVVSEDWRFRMITPRKGDYNLVPLNPAGRALADTWDPAKDEAAGNQCRSYGAASVLRAPGRLRIAWENDNTLRMDIEAGTQTRLFHFGKPAASAASAASADAPTWQGNSVAEWEYARVPRGQARTGNLKVVTTHMRPGYLRKNGVPYSANAVMTEFFRRLTTPDGNQWLLVITEINDPQYLTTPFVTSTQFKKLTDGSAWTPEPCSAK